MPSRNDLNKQLQRILTLYNAVLPEQMILMSLKQAQLSFEQHLQQPHKPFQVILKIGHCALHLEYRHSRDAEIEHRFGAAIVLPEHDISLKQSGDIVAQHQRVFGLQAPFVAATAQLFANNTLEPELKLLCRMLYTLFAEHQSLINAELAACEVDDD